MPAHADAPPGFASPIHHGLIHQPTLWKAPHRVVIYNILVCMMMCLWLSSRWAVIALAVHGAAALCWAYDPHLLLILWRAVKQPLAWGV